MGLGQFYVSAEMFSGNFFSCSTQRPDYHPKLKTMKIKFLDLYNKTWMPQNKYLQVGMSADPKTIS
jgi:hypothetical protein